jgi:RND family efflux transporter MFP subunit
MTHEDSSSRGQAGTRSTTYKTVVACVALLLVAVGVTIAILSTEPEATREGATRRSAMLVRTTTAVVADYRPEVSVLGTVVPAREVVISPQVSGAVRERAPAFTPGGRVTAGDMLLRIDPSDYEIALHRAESALHRAEADLALEEGRQAVARQDFELLGQQITNVNQALVLRGPQMETARADVEAARAAVEQAELDLRRTTLEAPFDALVLDRTVNIGSQVALGMDLGRLVGLDNFWVEATMPLRFLHRLRPPEQPGMAGAPARIHHEGVWPAGTFREATVYAVAGDLEEATRLARVLVSVPDPLALDPANTGQPRLVLGTFVEVRLQLEELRDVVRLSRDAVRKGNTVWIMNQGTLDIRPVTIAFQNELYAFISSGIEEGEAIVTSQLSRVVPDAELRTAQDETALPEAPAQESFSP